MEMSPSSPAGLCRDCSKRAINNTRYCADHQTNNNAALHKVLYDRYRADDPIRLLYRTPRWQHTRSVVFQRDILCQWPEGCPHAATVCDHYPLRARLIVVQFGDNEFFNPDRCRGLCKAHHDQHTAAEDSSFAGKQKK